MVLVKNCKFSKRFLLCKIHVCLSKIDREKVFADVLDKEKPLKTIKIELCTKNAKFQFL